MDRVKLDNEKKGSATYYMAESPYVYGERLYEIQKMQDIQIVSVKANIGRKPETSWRDISTEEEYKDIIWKTKGQEVYMCVFSVVKSMGTNEDNLPVTVKLDFEKKRLTLETEPYLNAEKELHLSEFFDMLTYENYYLDKEIDKMGEAFTLIKHISNIGSATLFIAFIAMIIWGAHNSGSGPTLIPAICGILAILFSMWDNIWQSMLRRKCKKKIAAMQNKKQNQIL